MYIVYTFAIYIHIIVNYSVKVNEIFWIYVDFLAKICKSFIHK